MSLFKTRQFWATYSEDDEYFDKNSIIVSKLNSSSDFIITGSQSGVLRIFQPKCELNDNKTLSGYNAGDLLLEKICSYPILQIGCGRLVSGSQNIQIAVLYPKFVSVYFLTTKEGATEHGTQYILQQMYEHKLKRLSFNFAIGQFGGTQNRDFICVQSIDGILSFFEQESASFYSAFVDFLLPGPLAYASKTDSFFIISSNWMVESYRYKLLSECGQENIEDAKLEKNLAKCEWSFNIGEAIMDISVIEDSINKESAILILGERNLFCLTVNGRLKFMKKFDFSPICFHVYLLDEKIISLVISETNTMLLYQNTSLKWSAQLEFQPIGIKRAFLEAIKGALVLLSEEGRLECCYLGTEPSLFVAPPVKMTEIDFEKASEELISLNKVIRNSHSDIKIKTANVERELSISVEIRPDLEPCVFQTKLKHAINQQMCTMCVELEPQATFEEVQITVSVEAPLKVVPQTHFFTNLSEKSALQCNVFLNEPYEVATMRVDVIVSFIASTGAPRTIAKTVMLPLKLVLETCQPQRESEHKIILNLNCSPASLATLFPDYNIGENSGSSMAWRSANSDDSEKIVTILLAKSSERYRLQSNSFASLNLLMEQLIYRLNRHYSNKSDFSIKFNSSSLPTNELLGYINEHFNARQKVIHLQDELTQLTTQFRIIQKRLIAKFKAKNPAPLSNMEILLDDTYGDIMNISDHLVEEMSKLEQSQVELTCGLKVVGNLIKLMDINKDLAEMLEAIFSQVVCDLEAQNWEDVFDGSLCYLLRTNLAKSAKDKLRAAQASFDEVKDISKLEKHLYQVLERVAKCQGSAPISEDNDANLESTDDTLHDNNELVVNEDESKDEAQEKELLPIGSQFGESSTRLLSARRSLLNRRHKIEN